MRSFTQNAKAAVCSQPKPKPIDGDTWADRCNDWIAETAEPAVKAGKRRSRKPPLILSGHGVRLRVDHGTLVVRNGFTHYPQQREAWRLFPGDWRLPSRIVILDADGGLSFDALAWLSEQDVPLVRIDWRGNVVHVTGGTGAAVDRKLVDAQLAARANGRWLILSRRLIVEKIDNCMATLRHAFPMSPAVELALKRIGRDTDLMRRSPPSTIDDLLGIEGRVAVAYFSAWQSFPLRWKGTGRRSIPEDWKRIGQRGSMASGRNHKNRNATHPVNAMLNYAYGILENQVRMRVVAAGLDPTIGYFHGTYRDKAALVYDLMEPLRPVVDRSILEFVQGHTFSPADFTLTTNGVCRLNPQLARTVVKTIDVDSPVDDLVRQFSSSISMGLFAAHDLKGGGSNLPNHLSVEISKV